MSEYTKGEMEAVSCSGGRICIQTKGGKKDGHQICGINPSVSASGFLTQEQHLANAQRIVQCWNACQGIEEPEKAITALIEACEEALEALVDVEGYCSAVPKLAAALTLAEGRK